MTPADMLHISLSNKPWPYQLNYKLHHGVVSWPFFTFIIFSSMELPFYSPLATYSNTAAPFQSKHFSVILSEIIPLQNQFGLI